MVEHAAAVLPHVGAAVLLLHLIEEAVHGRDLPRFVVATEEGDLGGVLGLEGEEVGEGLEGVIATTRERNTLSIQNIYHLSTSLSKTQLKIEKQQIPTQ